VKEVEEVRTVVIPSEVGRGLTPRGISGVSLI